MAPGEIQQIRGLDPAMGQGYQQRIAMRKEPHLRRAAQSACALGAGVKTGGGSAPPCDA